MSKNTMERVADWFALFLQWILETGAFILLPLLVYLLVYIGIGVDMNELYKLPEWMFAAVILHADTMRKQLLAYRNYKGYSLKVVRTLSLGLLGVVTCSIFLVLSLMAEEKTGFKLPVRYYDLQMIMFVAALGFSATISIIFADQNREGLLLKYMIPESDDAGV